MTTTIKLSIGENVIINANSPIIITIDDLIQPTLSDIQKPISNGNGIKHPYTKRDKKFWKAKQNGKS